MMTERLFGSIGHRRGGPRWPRWLLLCLAALPGTGSTTGPGAFAEGPVLISAAYPDGYLANDADEALQLWNVSTAAVDLSGWRVDDGAGRATFPPGAVLAAGHWWWLARDAAAFGRVFGQAPDWAWQSAAGDVRRMASLGGGPALANAGDGLQLVTSFGATADSLVYGNAGSDAAGDWQGRPVQPFAPGNVSGAHQVLYRKLDTGSGQPFPDSDTASDWASDAADERNGRRLRFPGWDLEQRLLPRRVHESARLEVAVTPDAGLAFLLRHLGAARTSVDLVAYTFEQPAVAELLADQARRGLRVRVLVDAAPAGGLSAGERWCLAQIAAAGGEVYWWDDGGEVGRRYRAMHMKLVVVDEARVVLGSENPGLGSFPADDQADGTAGRRGVLLATDAPDVVAWAREILALDLDPTAHLDLRPFQPRDPSRGAPAADFLPERFAGGAGYWPLAPLPLSTAGAFDFELISAPENSLAPDTGLLGLLARAGPGDEVLVQQLDEPLAWGDVAQGGAGALNPRPQAYLSAARRGARVRVLLDGYFDDPAQGNSNAATVRYLNEHAAAEELELAARSGNPAGLGLHNKMVLLRLNADPGQADRHWVHVGSLNGSQAAHKVNRELALQVDSAAVHRYLAAVFAWDWAESGAHAMYLPALMKASVIGGTGLPP